ncbi:hypothetical protein B0H14DRAFT_3487674 [Mycena olivaceomarginata]|nr:hypothetical protein B0H14DRAFT_3487674 [Mycena olivaceomarginata]
MAKWVGDARAAEIDAAEDSSDSEDEEVLVRIRGAPALPKWKRKTLAQLFGGSTKKHVQRLSQKEIEAEAERQADEDEDVQPDDGAVEIPSEQDLESGVLYFIGGLAVVTLAFRNRHATDLPTFSVTMAGTALGQESHRPSLRCESDLDIVLKVWTASSRQRPAHELCRNSLPPATWNEQAGATFLTETLTVDTFNIPIGRAILTHLARLLQLARCVSSGGIRTAFWLPSTGNILHPFLRLQRLLHPACALIDSPSLRTVAFELSQYITIDTALFHLLNAGPDPTKILLPLSRDTQPSHH